MNNIYGYPATLVERAAKRAAIRERCLAEAERTALAAYQSLKCCGYGGVSAPRHTSDPDGCKNDGSGCLCECHDLKENDE